MRNTAILGLFLTACATASPAPRAPECPAPTVAAAPVNPPVAAPAEPPPPAVTLAAPEDPDPAWTLAPNEVVLQEEHEPTFTVIAASDRSKPFGRMPTFTLYRDGRVIFAGELNGRRGVFTYRYGEHRTAQVLDHVRGLGFLQMRDHRSDCFPGPQGKICVADASMVVLRARLQGKHLRELRNYAGMAARKAAELQAIYDRIELLSGPQPATGGEYLYLAPAATLFIRVPRDTSDLDERTAQRAIPWPLPAERIDRAAAASGQREASVLTTPEIQSIIKVTGTNAFDNIWFRHGDRLFQVSLVPWLPGVDHRAAIEAAAKAPPPSPSPEE